MRPLAILCLVGLLSLPGIARAERSYRIVNKSSGLALSVVGTQLIQDGRRTGDPGQRWVLRPVSPQSSVFRIINLHTGLAVHAPADVNHTPVLMSRISASDRQFWIARYSDGVFFRLVPLRNADKAVDVPGSSRIRSRLQIYDGHGRDNQLWKLE